ncbi:MAG: protein-disulfide reductase DsbD family protein [Gammaproteobacteria bacterium]
MKKILFLIFLFPSLFANQIVIDTGHANVSLVKNSYDLKAEGSYIGIKFELDKNWHTYWKNPGDSGGPLEIVWELPNQFKLDKINWPKPELIPYPPLMTYGYNNEVIFPFKVSQYELNTNEEIGVSVDFLICADVCIPEKAYIKTSIADIPLDNKLDFFIEQVPNVTLPTEAYISGNTLKLKFSKTDKSIDQVYFYSDVENVVEHSAVQKLTEEEHNYSLKIQLFDSSKLSEISGVIVIDGKPFEVKSTVMNTPEIELFDELTLLQAVIFAFIGGLILNLMPCVFPVISLKVLSFVSMGGESLSRIRLHSLSFAVGVVVTFLTIAFAIILLKQSGSILGWGFQLQSPVMVSILALIMFIIGLVLLMDINIGASLTRLGSKADMNPNYMNSFSTGVLAVIVASPCTAPFMGAAIGYAILQPAIITLPVFLSLALGFAFPYLLLTAKPGLISSIPKPGKWMETLKEFFAFPMFATSLWLLWVFSIQVDSDQLISLLICFFAVSIFMWIYKSFTNQFIFFGSLLLTILFLFTQINNFSSSQETSSRLNDSLDSWYFGIEEEYQGLQQAYFINYTAAWCITCQANDKVALSRMKVKEFMAANDIKYVVADWTNKDKNILDALNIYGRSGVPLYVYWKPGMEKPQILPAILTEKIVLDALKK